MMFDARIALAAVAIFLAAMAGNPASAESFSGSIEGQVSIETSYFGSTYLYSLDPMYQNYSYSGAGTLSFGFSLGLPVNPEFGSIAQGLYFSVNDVGFYPTPDALIFADIGLNGDQGNYLSGFSSFESKGFHQNYSFSLSDAMGTFFGAGSPVPGMTAYASGFISLDVGSEIGTIIRETRVSFIGRVAPVSVPEPSGLVLTSLAGLCGLATTARRNLRDSARA
jgi:hypothetical protein